MKKPNKGRSVKTNKGPIYFRYEFSDEAGLPEGGDIFQFSSLAKLQEMIGEVLKVGQSDNVTVSLTVGKEATFFSFLKNTGVSREDAESEMAAPDLVPLPTKKKATKKKKAKKKLSVSMDMN